MRPLTQLMLPFTYREALLACSQSPPWSLPSFIVESTLSSPCSRPDSPLSRQSAAFAHLDSFPPFDLLLLDRRLCFFSFWQRRLWYICQLLSGTEITLSFSASPVCSSFSAKACAIRYALCWSRQHQQVCHFSSPPL